MGHIRALVIADDQLQSFPLPAAQRVSIQAELVRLGARFFIKHGTRPGVGIEVRRRRMQAYERWVPRPPAGVETVARPPRIPVWLRQDQVVSYFITLCVENRRPVLDNPPTFQAIKAFCRANQNWHTAAAVAMPDHFHALICPMVKSPLCCRLVGPACTPNCSWVKKIT